MKQKCDDNDTNVLWFIYLFFNSSEGIVYNVDEMTGGLVISHRLRLPTRDYPGIFSADAWIPVKPEVIQWLVVSFLFTFIMVT